MRKLAAAATALIHAIEESQANTPNREKPTEIWIHRSVETSPELNITAQSAADVAAAEIETALNGLKNLLRDGKYKTPNQSYVVRKHPPHPSVKRAHLEMFTIHSCVETREQAARIADECNKADQSHHYSVARLCPESTPLPTSGHLERLPATIDLNSIHAAWCASGANEAGLSWNDFTRALSGSKQPEAHLS